jgi:hypothetical protein
MPTLTADHYFTIGTTHARAGEPCQDYALSGALKDARVYGIVTDGCSGANARTDLGARVLALALESELQNTSSLEDCFTQHPSTASAPTCNPCLWAVGHKTT